MGRIGYRPSTRVQIAGAMLATALITAPVTVLASHQFSDVPTDHPFHQEIGAVAAAGIARGFDDGTYRPSSNMTRQAMAAFFERGVGRAGVGSRTVAVGNSAGLAKKAVIAEVSIDAGAAGPASSGFVVLLGTVNASTSSPSSCPCRLYTELALDGVGLGTSEMQVPSVGDESGWARSLGTIHEMVGIVGDTSSSYQMRVELVDANVASVTLAGELTALYVPLGPDGDNTPLYEHSCADLESEPNSSIGTADAFGTSCIRGNLAASDEDWFQIGVASGQTLTLETRAESGAGCEGDTVVDLYNSMGVFITGNDDAGVGSCSFFSHTVSATGTYYMRVKSFFANQTFRYRLTADIYDPAAAPGVEDDRDDVAKE